MSEHKSYVIIREKFTVSQVQVTYTSISNRPINAFIEASLDKIWSEQLELAEQRGMELYDSNAYRLNDFQMSSGHLSLQLAPVNYRTHAAMKSFYNSPQLSKRYFDKTLIADSLIKTLDGKYILGKAEKVVESAIYLIGGTCAKSRAEIASASDLFGYAGKRVGEILNIPESKILVSSLIGIIQNEIGCVHAIFDTRVTLSSHEIVKAFHPNGGISELIVVDEGDINAYLNRSEGYVTVVADLLDGLI